MSFAWAKIQSLDEPTWIATLSYLELHLLADSATENAIKRLRAELLELICSGLTEAPRLLALLAALAIFCGDSEFVIAESVNETELLDKLEPERSVAHVLILRCYRKVDPDDLPTADVEQLCPIVDGTSLAVKEMYEQNPYPRWKVLPAVEVDDREIDILIAGCGSGRHPLAAASGSPKSRVTGVDLSLPSLGYGLAKAREYGIQNVRLVHGDMLDIGSLGLSFDTISAVGSVHHVSEPLRAVVALRDVLRPGGTLKLAVYSLKGRLPALAAIDLRSQLAIPGTVAGIREVRRIIYDLPNDHPAKGVLQYEDFYSISGCRDMLFHVKEHNFTVAEFFDLIEQSDMELANFALPAHFNGPTSPTRENLIKLEQSHPGFAGPLFRAVLRS